jgi:hypothetical protein
MKTDTPFDWTESLPIRLVDENGYDFDAYEWPWKKIDIPNRTVSVNLSTPYPVSYRCQWMGFTAVQPYQYNTYVG